MAIQLPSFTADTGAVHQNSYWRVVSVNTDDAGKNARILFYGYVDKPSSDARKEPLGLKAYDLSGADYDAAALLNSKTSDVKALTYGLAKVTKDVQVAPDPKTPDVTPPAAGFFDGGQDV